MAKAKAKLTKEERQQLRTNLEKDFPELFNLPTAKQRKTLEALLDIALKQGRKAQIKEATGKLSEEDKDIAVDSLMEGKAPKKVAASYGLTFSELWKKFTAMQRSSIRMAIEDAAAEKAAEKARLDAEAELDALIKR